jgi:hypothetical protein
MGNGSMPPLSIERTSTGRNQQERESREIPIGNASLIHASFKAGLKPAAIARRDFLNSDEKTKR